MKIIDLLNKIANGEEVPKKIKYDGDIWKLNTLENTYDNGKCCLFEDYIDKKYVITDVVNDEVEIIEEDKKIKQLTIDDELADKKAVLNNIGLQRNLIKLTNKINEIIDYLNKGEEK